MKVIEQRTFIRPKNCLCVWDDPDYTMDVTIDPVGYCMFWLYFDSRGEWHFGRCVTRRHAEQCAKVYGYKTETPAVSG